MGEHENVGMTHISCLIEIFLEFPVHFTFPETKRHEPLFHILSLLMYLNTHPQSHFALFCMLRSCVYLLFSSDQHTNK